MFQVQYAGSVYDGIKIGKLDEFDMDIIIRLPISYQDGENGIIIENHAPGFVKLKIGRAFDDLDNQPDWEKYHKVTREWRDPEKYFLQNKFRFWMQSTVQKAMNLLGNKVIVNNVPYSIIYRESGPAFTLNVRGKDKGQNFEFDVDLVPVIRFLAGSEGSCRWPQGYRTVPAVTQKNWFVVPKPIKSESNVKIKNRCWRLAFHDFEKDLMKGCDNLKPTIRLVSLNF